MNNFKRVFAFGGGAVLLILFVAAGLNLFCGSAETNAETVADLAQAKLYKEWDWAGAEQAFQKALELDPELGRAHAHYSWYLQLIGGYDEAVAEMKRACEVEPQMPLWPAWLGWLYWGEGKYEAAINEAQKSLELTPDFPVGLYVQGLAYSKQGIYEEAIVAHEKSGAGDPRWRSGLGLAYALAGHREEALKIAAELGDEDNTWNTWGLAEIYTALGEKDQAFQWLEAAYEQRHPYFPWIGWNPYYESLRNDPRFLDLLQRLNLSEKENSN